MSVWPVASGADVSTPKNDGWTPLIVAVLNGHDEVVRFLATEAGADVNTPDDDGRTPSGGQGR